MATPKIIADFESSLATAIAIGGTSFTLSSATDDDGVALPNGLYYFTVDNGSTQKEYLAGTLAGTSVTGVVSVSRQGVETSGAARAHRVGASVIMTDFATYVKYMNEIALVSAPDASNIAKGVVEAATLAEVRARTGTGGTGAKLAVTPDVLDDLPTQDQKAILAAIEAGTYFATPQVVTFTSSGTWTKDAGLKYIIVEVQGPGAGGGGEGGNGGGAGGYAKKLILASALGATETVTVGTGGSAGASGSGPSTFTVTSGTDVVGNAGNTNGTGGTATGGDINIQGGKGSGGGGSDATQTGHGGSSILGMGGVDILDSTSNSSGGSNGFVGTGYGSGGSAARPGSDGTFSGGAGNNGIVIVTEYYS